MCHVSWFKTIHNEQCESFQDYTKIILKYSKMLTSFVVNVDQINHMSITNDNMYTFNQRMKMFFVDFYFSYKDHVGYNYGCMWLVKCD